MRLFLERIAMVNKCEITQVLIEDFSETLN